MYLIHISRKPNSYLQSEPSDTVTSPSCLKLKNKTENVRGRFQSKKIFGNFFSMAVYVGPHLPMKYGILNQFVTNQFFLNTEIDLSP